MEPTEPDLARQAARRLVERTRARQAARAAVRVKGREAAVRAARALIEKFAVTRVWLFGSLAGQGGLVHEETDVDLAVEGLEAALLDRAGCVAEDAAGMPLDLVRMEAAAPTLRDRILDEGELLHVSGD